MSEAARSLFRRTTASRSSRQSASARPGRAASKPSRRAAAETPSQPRRTNVYPPIVTRQTSERTTPLNRRASAPARRQYYYALSTPGAEVRLPALPVIRPSWRMISGLLAAVMILAMSALWNAPTFQIGDITISGAQRIAKVDLEAVMNMAGEPAVTVSPRLLEEALAAAFPDMKSVDVTMGFPARLAVAVVERQPVIAWEQDGKTSWIDMEGYAFPVRGEPGTPLVTVMAEGSPPSLAAEEAPAEGSASTAAEKAASIAGAPQAVPFLPPEMITPLAEMAGQAPEGMSLAYSPDYGLGWNDPQGWRVYFGQDTANIALKLSEYQAIVDYLVPRNIHPSLISVEYLHAPFYRLEP